jgi:prepilin-type N-terminal cleavage/methylation domain-containing protein
MRRGGFTLAEVLATMVLIGIVVPVVMQGISMALMASSHARYMAQAAALGEAKLSELVVSGQWTLAAGNGDFSPDWPQYRWTSRALARDFGANEMTLDITWTERGLEQKLSLSTIAYDTGSTAGGSASGVLP